MAIKRIYIVLVLNSMLVLEGRAQDSLKMSIQGQVSAWALMSPFVSNYALTGARYLPQFNASKGLDSTHYLDIEVSANMYGSLDMWLFDSIRSNGTIKPYRAWARYYGNQFELRVGLQKISFGSSVIFRPLRWFDQLDPRDPLQITNGVYAALGHYYFLNNANIWVWGLYGNKKPKGWDALGSSLEFPELGGRIQLPTHSGEIAASFHHRKVDDPKGVLAPLSEQKIGLDGKWDVGVGLMLEASYTYTSKELSLFQHQTFISLGIDYTFGIGNGLGVIAEHLLTTVDKEAFGFQNTGQFTAGNLSYPIGINDNLNLILYYDWTNENIYNFLNWQHQFNRWSLNTIAYLNPKQSVLPTQGTSFSSFGGLGFQIMAVFNH